MNAGTKGTKRYKYPTVPTAKKVQIGTTPFRGVPFVPTPKQAPDTDLLGHEIQPQKRTNSKPEAAALVEVIRWWHGQNVRTVEPQRWGGRFIRFGWPGYPDVLGQRKDGRLLGVEVKSRTGRLRPEQAVFLERIRGAGGVAFVARDCRDVFDNLKLQGGIRQ